MPEPAAVPDRELFASAWQSSPRPEMAEFSRWCEDFLAASPATRGAMLAEGIELATTRRAAMAELIRTDPREAIANTPPLVVRNPLPAAITELLEERVSGRGDVFRVMGLPHPGESRPVPTVDTASLGGRYFTAHRYGERALTPSLKDVSVHGVALEGHLAVSSSAVKVMEEGETVAETTEICIVTDEKPVLPEGETAAVRSTAIVGDHAYEMCCPFCVEDLDTRLARLEQRGLTTPRALGEIGPQGIGDSGVSGTNDFPGKPPLSLTHGPKSILFMRVDFSDRGYPANLSEAFLQNQVFAADGMDARMRRMSYDKTSITTATVTPVMRMPKTSTQYWKNEAGETDMGRYWGPISDDARAAASALGYNPDSYTCRVIVHDGFVDVGAAGWGGGDTIWCNGNADKKLLVHEYGHVFWLPHANSWKAADGNPLSSAREHVEYGDSSDPMGNAWGADLNNDYNAYYKSLCGWLPDSTVQTISHSGTYRIHQFDGAADLSKTLALKITRENDMDLWVMFRGDSISQNLYNQGAYVIATPVGRFGDSHVLDFNDATGDAWNAPLSQGQVFDDPVSGIKITTAGRGGAGSSKYLYVKVDFAPTYVHGHRHLVANGIYAFRNKLVNQYLDVPNNSAAAGTRPQLWTYNGSDAQKWVVERNGDGSYRLTHFGTNLCLDVEGNSGSDGGEVQQWDRNDSDAQRWVLSLWPDGFLKLRHRGTNKVLESNGSGDVRQWNDNPYEGQRWEPRLLGIDTGIYRIVPRHAQALALGLRGRAATAGTQVEQQSWGGGAWQRWAVLNLGGGQFRIFPEGKPGQTLAIAAGSAANGAGAVLEPYTGAASQRFTITHTDQGWVRITPVHATAQCLDVSGVSTAPGAALHQWQYLGGNNQQWRFDDADL